MGKQRAGLPAKFEAELDLHVEVAGESVHRAEAADSFLQHTVERGVGTVKAAQAWRQHVGVADGLSRGGFWPATFRCRAGHTTCGRLRPISRCGAMCARGITQFLHRGDACDAQALLHTAADAGDVFELEAVELVGQFVEVEGGQPVGLFELAGELGEEAIGSEADRGADMGPDVGFERGFDLQWPWRARLRAVASGAAGGQTSRRSRARHRRK